MSEWTSFCRVGESRIMCPTAAFHPYLNMVLFLLMCGSISFFKRKKTPVYCIFVGTSPSSWGEIFPYDAQSKYLARLCVEWLILCNWPDSEQSLLKTSPKNKRQKLLEVRFLRAQMGLLLCVHERSDSPTEKPVYCPCTFKTSLRLKQNEPDKI